MCENCLVICLDNFSYLLFIHSRTRLFIGHRFGSTVAYSSLRQQLITLFIFRNRKFELDLQETNEMIASQNSVLYSPISALVLHEQYKLTRLSNLILMKGLTSIHPVFPFFASLAARPRLYIVELLFKYLAAFFPFTLFFFFFQCGTQFYFHYGSCFGVYGTRCRSAE